MNNWSEFVRNFPAVYGLFANKPIKMACGPNFLLNYGEQNYICFMKT
jgi:hypothetical protein